MQMLPHFISIHQHDIDFTAAAAAAASKSKQKATNILVFIKVHKIHTLVTQSSVIICSFFFITYNQVTLDHFSLNSTCRE